MGIDGGWGLWVCSGPRLPGISVLCLGSLFECSPFFLGGIVFCE